MTQVFIIETVPATGNKYTVGRSENWFLRSIEVEGDGKDYIRQKTRQTTILPTFLASIKTEEEKEKFVDDFCFNDDTYLKYRRYFLEIPTEDFLKSVESDGIKVEKIKTVCYICDGKKRCVGYSVTTGNPAVVCCTKCEDGYLEYTIQN